MISNSDWFIKNPRWDIIRTPFYGYQNTLMLKTTLALVFHRRSLYFLFFFLLINSKDYLLRDGEMASKIRSPGAGDFTQINTLLHQSRIRIEVQVGVLVRIPDKSVLVRAKTTRKPDQIIICETHIDCQPKNGVHVSYLQVVGPTVCQCVSLLVVANTGKAFILPWGNWP
jgi:hypothetical protein